MGANEAELADPMGGGSAEVHGGGPFELVGVLYRALILVWVDSPLASPQPPECFSNH